MFLHFLIRSLHNSYNSMQPTWSQNWQFYIFWNCEVYILMEVTAGDRKLQLRYLWFICIFQLLLPIWQTNPTSDPLVPEDLSILRNVIVDIQSIKHPSLFAHQNPAIKYSRQI